MTDDEALAELQRVIATGRAILARARIEHMTRPPTAEERRQLAEVGYMLAQLRDGLTAWMLDGAGSPAEMLAVAFRMEGRA